MKLLLLILGLFISITATFSQEEDEYFREDSLHLTQFLQQVDHIDLCELGWTCYMDSVHVEETEEKKWMKRCYLGGAIRYPNIDYSKIDCKKQAFNKEAFFKVLISSTNNTTFVRGMCYEPRNGILFFDKEENLLGYLEICFACSNCETLSKLGGMNFTSEQYVELEYLFNQNGLKTESEW